MKAKSPITILQKASPPPPKASSTASSSNAPMPTSKATVPKTTTKPTPGKAELPASPLTKHDKSKVEAAVEAAARKTFEQESVKLLGFYGTTKTGENRKQPLADYEN